MLSNFLGQSHLGGLIELQLTANPKTVLPARAEIEQQPRQPRRYPLY